MLTMLVFLVMKTIFVLMFLTLYHTGSIGRTPLWRYVNLKSEVFTCFKTNPRRRPNESAGDVTNRRAFRLCVNAADREIACLILLSGRIWYVSQIGFSPTNALKKATVIMGNDSVLTDLVSLESRSHCSALLIMIITTLLKLKTQVVTLALQAPCVRKQLLLTSLLSPM